MEVKKATYEEHDEGSNILYKESEVHSRSLQIVLLFLPFMVDLTFGKILNIWKSHSR